jgi:DNA-3-methyladenine glycosylase I
MEEYHDTEWGVPVRDDRTLFEFLVLEGAQAGLSWSTVLAKRDEYRRVFHNFEIERVARMNERSVQSLLKNAGIIRNEAKIRSAIMNATVVMEIQQSEGSLCNFLWSIVGGRPVVSSWRVMSDVPATTDESVAMSRDLKKRGMKFVGPTICYAFMQATGMVNDHLVSCFRHAELCDVRRK